MLKMRSDFPPTIMIPILLALNKHLHFKNHNGRLGIKNILRSNVKKKSVNFTTSALHSHPFLISK